MATSGTTTFATNRDSLIAGALRLCGAVALGETPTSDQVTEASEALNMMVKAWQADGMPLWAISEYALTPIEGIADYDMGIGYLINIPKPLKVIQAYLRNTTNNIDIPMTVITRDEYNRLGNKAVRGQPIQIFYEPQRDYGVLHVFPTPDVITAFYKTIYFTYQRPFQDFDSSTDEPDFPQEWYEAVKYGLASRLAGEYGIPLEDRKQLMQEAVMIKQEALSFGTENGSFFFTVDKRNY